MGAECSRCGRDIYYDCAYCALRDENDQLRESLRAALMTDAEASARVEKYREAMRKAGIDTRPTPPDAHDLTNEMMRVGDALQSAASRVAEWVIIQENVPYEVALAAAEAVSEVDEWTALRVSGEREQ